MYSGLVTVCTCWRTCSSQLTDAREPCQLEVFATSRLHATALHFVGYDLCWLCMTSYRKILQLRHAVFPRELAVALLATIPWNGVTKADRSTMVGNSCKRAHNNMVAAPTYIRIHGLFIPLYMAPECLLMCAYMGISCACSCSRWPISRNPRTVAAI